MKRCSLALAALLLVGVTVAATTPVRAGQAAAKSAARTELVARGEYLVRTWLCHDCHTVLQISGQLRSARGGASLAKYAN